MNFYFGNRKDTKNYQETEWAQKKPQWKQVHGVKSIELTASNQECGEVDGLWTRLKNQPVMIVAADCTPILLYRNDGQAVAALHSGWRGTYDQILDAFFKSLPNDLNDPKDWSAKIGPCIHACCYEVTEALIEQFVGRFSWINRKLIEPEFRKLDLVAVTQAECQRLGVRVEFSHPDCTRCTLEGRELKYFSYRAGDRSSRQYSWIELA